MDNAASEAARRSFHANPEECRVGFQPSERPAPPVSVFRSSSLSRSPIRSSPTQSGPSGRKDRSFRRYPALDLPAAQAAALPGRVKQTELDDHHHPKKWETRAEGCRLPDGEAGRLRGGLRRARDTVARKPEREQPSAELRPSALPNGGTPPLFQPPSDNSKLFLDLSPPVQPRHAHKPAQSTPGGAPT